MTEKFFLRNPSAEGPYKMNLAEIQTVLGVIENKLPEGKIDLKDFAINPYRYLATFKQSLNEGEDFYDTMEGLEKFLKTIAPILAAQGIPIQNPLLKSYYDESLDQFGQSHALFRLLKLAGFEREDIEVLISDSRHQLEGATAEDKMKFKAVELAWRTVYEN